MSLIFFQYAAPQPTTPPAPAKTPIATGRSLLSPNPLPAPDTTPPPPGGNTYPLPNGSIQIGGPPPLNADFTPSGKNHWYPISNAYESETNTIAAFTANQMSFRYGQVDVDGPGDLMLQMEHLGFQPSRWVIYRGGVREKISERNPLQVGDSMRFVGPATAGKPRSGEGYLRLFPVPPQPGKPDIDASELKLNVWESEDNFGKYPFVELRVEALGEEDPATPELINMVETSKPIPSQRVWQAGPNKGKPLTYAGVLASQHKKRPGDDSNPAFDFAGVVSNSEPSSRKWKTGPSKERPLVYMGQSPLQQGGGKTEEDDMNIKHVQSELATRPRWWHAKKYPIPGLMATRRDPSPDNDYQTPNFSIPFRQQLLQEQVQEVSIPALKDGQSRAGGMEPTDMSFGGMELGSEDERISLQPRFKRKLSGPADGRPLSFSQRLRNRLKDEQMKNQELDQVEGDNDV